ncbi:MAG: hypothetical protein PsegKO_29720 [Pseudohongiellaceae bacterium]
MTDTLQLLGSFATIWLATWFICALALISVYPLLRSALLRWHPAIASNLLLLLLAFPFLLGLLSTLFLFAPAQRSALVSSHCHGDIAHCAAHVPLIEQPGLVPIGLLLVLAIVTLLAARLRLNLKTAARLRAQLQQVAKDVGDYQLLENPQPFVFTLGWWRNQVFMTRGLLSHCDQQDVAVILAHEQAHARRYDNLRLLIASLLTLVIPGTLSKVMRDDLHLLIESACDFEAAEQLGDLEVAETLLKIQKLSPANWQLGHCVLLSAFTGSEVELRIKALLHGRPQTRLQLACVKLSLLVLLTASVLLVDPLHHSIEVLLAIH